MEECCNNLVVELNGKRCEVHSILTYKTDNNGQGCIGHDLNGQCHPLHEPVEKILSVNLFPKLHRLYHYSYIFRNNPNASRGGLGAPPMAAQAVSPCFIGTHCMTMAIATSTHNLTPILQMSTAKGPTL